MASFYNQKKSTILLLPPTPTWWDHCWFIFIIFLPPVLPFVPYCPSPLVFLLLRYIRSFPSQGLGFCSSLCVACSSPRSPVSASSSSFKSKCKCNYLEVTALVKGTPSLWMAFPHFIFLALHTSWNSYKRLEAHPGCRPCFIYFSIPLLRILCILGV